MFIPRNMIREYLRYVIPTTVTFLLLGIYSIVDGVFVGHTVGDPGIAGINVAWPAVALVIAVGMGIGMGGGVISSIARGAGKMKDSQEAIGTTFVMLIVASIPLLIVYLVLAGPLCDLLGGQGETLTQATLYLEVMAWAVPFQIFATGCTPLIRNQGHATYAMAVQVTAGVLNAVLDYFFVMLFGWGTPGAAWATVVSQIVACVLVVVFFVLRKNRIPLASFRPHAHIVLHALKLGAAPFGLTLVPEAAVVVLNINFSLYGGEVALAAYAVIGYTAGVVQMLIQSIGDGSQPLISRYFGAGDANAVRELRNTNYLVAIGIGALGWLVIFLLREAIPLAFGCSAATAAIVAVVMPIYSTAYILHGFTHASTSYFYAIDNARYSSAIIYGEAILVVVVVCSFGYAFGVDGIWFSMLTVQAILSCFVGWLLFRHHKRMASDKITNA